MGEKSFARQALCLLRESVGESSQEATAALDWARDQRDWLWPGRDIGGAGDDTEAIDWDSVRLLARQDEVAEEAPEMFDCIGTVAKLLDLDDSDRRLIEVVAAFQRLPRLSQLRSRLSNTGANMIALLGRIAGADGLNETRARRSLALRLGLLCIERDCTNTAELQLHWRFAQLIDELGVDEDRLVAALVGTRQDSALDVEDFAEQAADVDLLVRLLRGALSSRAEGVNVLIYGPPGTGKTELARTLAEAAGARLFAVGETDDDGDEPRRYERLEALGRAQRLLTRRNDSVLLFDELEDLFVDNMLSVDGDRRSRSKVFVNRLLERNAVPVIWTSNALDIDRAHLRRMSFVLRMTYPSARARERIAERAAAAVAEPATAVGLGALLRTEPESASIARVALKTAALAGGRADDAAAAGIALIRGLRGGRELAPRTEMHDLDLSLYDGGVAIEQLVAQLTSNRAPLDFSLLLSGPPGTGKTVLAAHLAQRLDRPLAVKRASDLLSKWVGGTEANIAAAFAEARDDGAILLLDEADSLLSDRADAKASWEVTQVNELLTWMDTHPLPFVAATNFADRLDPAVFRRFVFKLALRPLGPDAAERAFAHFFGLTAPAGIRLVQGLTPGDFAVVKRQLRYRPEPSAAEIVDLLRREAEAKPGPASRLGF